MMLKVLFGLSGCLAISVTTMSPAQVTALGQVFVGNDPGLTLVSIQYSGADLAIGSYSQGPQNIGDGIILSTGRAADASLSENSFAGTSNGDAGSSAFCSLAIPNVAYHDAALLTLAVQVDRTKYNGLQSNVIFGTEEYPTYVGSQFNDLLAFFVDGVQFAKDASGNVVSVNGGFFSAANVVTDTGLVYDGSTKILSLVAPLTDTTAATTVHTIQITVCDAGDSAYDSAVLLTTLSGISCIPNCASGLAVTTVSSVSTTSTATSSASSTATSVGECPSPYETTFSPGPQSDDLYNPSRQFTGALTPNFQASSIKTVALNAYSETACAALCDGQAGCTFFNIYLRQTGSSPTGYYNFGRKTAQKPKGVPSTFTTTGAICRLYKVTVNGINRVNYGSGVQNTPGQYNYNSASLGCAKVNSVPEGLKSGQPSPDTV